MEMSVSEIRRRYLQSESKWQQVTVLAELNGCSREEIAAIVYDIPIEKTVSDKKKNNCKATRNQGAVYHRDSEKQRNEYYKSFSKKLKKMMKMKDYSRYRLAKECNIARSSVDAYVNGKSLPDVYSFTKIVRCLEISADELIEDKNIYN